MSEDTSRAIQKSEPAKPTLAQRLRQFVARRRQAATKDPEVMPPEPKAKSGGAPDGDLAALRAAVERLDARLSVELGERDGKMLEEMRRGLVGLETELSERFSSSVLENRRVLMRGLVVLGVGIAACLGGLVYLALTLR